MFPYLQEAGGKRRKEAFFNIRIGQAYEEIRIDLRKLRSLPIIFLATIEHSCLT